MSLAVAASLFVSAPCAFAQALSNAEVTMLLNAGLGAEAVIAKIETSEGNYDTSTETILQLARDGMPSAVIAAMVKKSSAPVAMSDNSPDPTVPHYPGFYMFDDWSPAARMWKIDPTTSSQTKTGGLLGYVVTGGLASMSYKAVIQGESAKINTPRTRPDFYAYFGDPDTQQSSMFASGFSGSVQTPNEFSLIKFDEKKDRREARVGSFNIAGAKTGVMDKDRIPFTYRQIAPNVYSVTPEIDLEPGEYGFIFAVSGGAGPGLSGGAAGARVFDFTVVGR